ncbi:IS21 family transposase [Lacticaseibacillus hegangensis]|uniref:IS21 family transposase n=1 Tax=Lacticaseibacillus hegangensis TaxID=2486010 RepID=A0ABW4CVH4_9LACO|nr:IS21 family transposase [Lacticaseibacillus hegangensis]
MRQDIREGVRKYMIEDMKPNFAAIAEQYNCDYRTVKRAYEDAKRGSGDSLPQPTETRAKRPSKLDPFREKIDEKLNIPCSAMAIYKFIVKHGFTGKYSIVRDYCARYKKHQVHKATIRVEHTAGLSAQVDWKEEMTLYNTEGKAFTFNIFLYVLPYSKLKYLTLILERSQDTLFNCLDDAFHHTGGIPKEIWFDNMKQVVDHTKSDIGQRVVLNERFKQFSQDAGYKPVVCRVFRPQTKGVVEALARTTERLRVYNNEFYDEVDLVNIVDELCYDLNHEVSQATEEIPIYKWENEEKEYLHELPDNLLDLYFEEDITRVVSKESMVIFRKCKYSVDPRYIGRTVGIELTNDEQHIQIYYNGEMIRAHEITTHQFNYNTDDQVKILGSDLLKGQDPEDILGFIKEHLSDYDKV